MLVDPIRLRAARRLVTRQGFAILLSVAMLAVAQCLEEPEVIFPEIAALATGCLVVPKRVWAVDRLRLVILLTLAAVAGYVLSRYSPLPPLANVALGFAFVGSLLIMMRASLYPAISACLLPVVLNVGSWLYPAAVFGLTLGVAGVQWLMERARTRAPLPFRPIATPRAHRCRHWLLMLAAVVLITAVPMMTGHRYFILPPLIVLFVEFTRPATGLRKAPFAVMLLIVVAAIVGNAGHLCLTQSLGWPPALTVIVVLGILYVISNALRRQFAPAAAIALVPNILQQPNAYLFPLEVTLGALVFILVAYALFRPAGERLVSKPSAEEDCKECPRINNAQ